MYKQEIENGIILTVGNFDGVHLGHQLIISKVKETAQKMNMPSAVLTFEPHPSIVISKKKNFLLIDSEQKKEIINNYGVDYLHVINFNKFFLEINYDDFITKILVAKYNIRHMVVGKNFTFGNKKLGDISKLEEYSKIHGYSLTVVDPLMIDSEICSSSSIRDCLRCGEIEIANKLLSRPFQISGIVMRGVCRGREIGFPTINVPIEDYTIKPKFGTYYARVVFLNNNNWLYGVVNIGMRPTFRDLTKPIAEMHILNFNEDSYGKKVKIQLLHFIRSERNFNNISELTRQINRDIIDAQKINVCL